MKLHQLKVEYDAEQDRLIMLVATRSTLRFMLDPPCRSSSSLERLHPRDEIHGKQLARDRAKAEDARRVPSSEARGDGVLYLRSDWA